MFRKNNVVDTEIIHNEVDKACLDLQEQLKREVEEINDDINVKIRRKQDKLAKLGFSSVPIKELATTKKEEFMDATRFNYLKLLNAHFPDEKILSLAQFEEICKKYNLIYARIELYTEDVPEKNLDELLNLTPCPVGLTRPERVTFKIKGAKFYSGISMSDKVWYTQKFTVHLPLDQYRRTSDEDLFNIAITQRAKDEGYKPVKNSMVREYNRIIKSTISYRGFHIAAPKSHFSSLKNKNISLSFFSSKTEVLEKPKPVDPIVFEFLVGDFVRICTKWGTPDDQSFNDPSLQK